MQYKKFHIQNFKGIHDQVISLAPRGAGLFTLIGLNESGKTTILEAIQSFQFRENKLSSLYAQTDQKEDSSGVEIDPTTFVPKKFKANFSDSILVTATVSLSEHECSAIVSALELRFKCKIDQKTIPLVFDIARGYKFQDSDFVERVDDWRIDFQVKAKGGRQFKSVKKIKNQEIWSLFSAHIRVRLPNIVYFPTFLFNQPDKIILNAGEDETAPNALYREIIANVAKSLQKPLDIKKHIVDRILTEETLTSKLINLALLAPDKQEQIEAAKTQISEHLTDTVFQSWSKTFGGDFTDREIRLNINGETNDDGSPQVYAQFVIKDKSSTYQISEMSLGFRWFFSFILFTLYRVSASTYNRTLFLLDEPASNLHSRAQMQLLESFPRIAEGENALMYSTHSHYMVNPDWLEQAFIVANAAIDYQDLTDTSVDNKRRYTDVQVRHYREFVGQNPDKVTYFQPVLDKLDVTPSRIDLVKPSVLVEGKGDYAILEYVRRVKLGHKDSFSVVPTRGATGMEELIGLFLGWSVPFIICLDDDKPGRACKQKYIDEWGLSPDNVWTWADVAPSLSEKKIEGLLENKDIELVKSHFAISGRPSKKQIRLFFSEKLAQRNSATTSSQLTTRVKKFHEKAELQLSDHFKTLKKRKPSAG